MPVTVQVFNHPALPVRGASKSQSPESILKAAYAQKANYTQETTPLELIQSSFKTNVNSGSVLNCKNGFVDTISTAYRSHHHVIIRPDDVWIAIQSQFNFYVNAHAEELRDHFVAHEDKKDLVISEEGDRWSVDFGRLALRMTDELDKNVVDKELKDWILPNFTTTTDNDTVACSVLMMSALKAYFAYEFNCITCGIPSVTLEGEKSDWENILNRLDKLPSFGSEPSQWSDMLRLILQKCVGAFDGKPDIDFWKRICRLDAGCAQDYLSGWITAFCVWDSNGKWMLYGGEEIQGVRYPNWIDYFDIPHCFGEVDIKLTDHGETFDCVMVAGHMAATISGKAKDTLGPLPSWFLYSKHSSRPFPTITESLPTGKRSLPVLLPLPTRKTKFSMSQLLPKRFTKKSPKSREDITFTPISSLDHSRL